MYHFLNKLIFLKIKSFTALKNFSKTPLGETGCLGNLYFLLAGCLGIIIKRKQTSESNQTFTCKYKINKYNTKVSTHY